LIFLLASLLLPSLFWDRGPETVGELQKAGIERVSVPASLAQVWKAQATIAVEVEDPAQFIKALTPSVSFRPRVASATRAPWVNSNGWRCLRNPDGHFYYDAPGMAASLAAAEAFMYNVRASIQTDEAGLGPFGGMLRFVRTLPEKDLAPLANIGFLDDGSEASGEFMNLLVRRNLLFRVVPRPDPKLDLTVRLGTSEYPSAEAANPSLLAEKVRSRLTDEKRLLRIYGSEVVVGRLVGNGDMVRLLLINYGAARGPVDGVRVRVLGAYPKQHVAQFDSAETALLDTSVTFEATEFTLPQLKSFAIIDLAR
jgi:hypothetical protein